MMSVEKGVLAAAAKKPAMPMITKVAGWGTSDGHQLCKSSPKAPPPQPPMTIDGPNTPPEPPLPMVRPVVRILPSAIARSTQALTAVSLHHRALNGAVAEGEHGQHLLLSAHEEVEHQRHQAGQEGAEGRPEVRGQRQAVEDPHTAVERPRVERGQDDHQHHQQRVRAQLPRAAEREAVRDREKGFPARIGPERAVGEDAGNGGRHDYLGRELRRTVEHLGGEQGAGQRARKMAAMPAPIPAAMSTRRSDAFKWSRLASREPNPAPIWAIGPSRPPDPPVPSVKALATIFTAGTRGRICPWRWW